MLGVRLNVVAGLAAMAPLLSGCLYATGGYETFDHRIQPVAASIQPSEPPPTPTEVVYARDTARVVFRRRASERTTDLVARGPDGYALCLRSGRAYALLVFARRIFEDAVSQAADDATILRSSADTAVCRQGGRRWVAV